MGAHPVIYPVLQLHVVKFNQNVLNGSELGNKWGKSGVRKSAQSHTPSAMKFFSSCRKVKENCRCLFLFYWVVLIQNPIHIFLGKNISVYSLFMMHFIALSPRPLFFSSDIHYNTVTIITPQLYIEIYILYIIYCC